MPCQVSDIKVFIEICRREDAIAVRVKKLDNVYKFKVRCARYVYTLAIRDAAKAEKLRQSLPPGLEVTEEEEKRARK